MENNLDPKVPFLQYKSETLSFEEATNRNIISLIAAIHALHSLLTDEQKAIYGSKFAIEFTKVSEESDRQSKGL